MVVPDICAPIDGVGISALLTIESPAPIAKAVNAAVQPIAKVPAIAAALPTLAKPAIAAIAILFP
jgi:hypothetical protein